MFGISLVLHYFSVTIPCLSEGFYKFYSVCAVAQLVDAPLYKPEGCEFDSRWGHFFNRTVALGSTQPLTEITSDLPWGVKAAGA